MTGQSRGAPERSSGTPQKELVVSAQVFAGAKKEKVIKISEEKYEIYVKEPAQNNLANKRVLYLLSQIFKGARAEILTGHRSPKKRFLIKY